MIHLQENMAREKRSESSATPISCPGPTDFLTQYPASVTSGFQCALKRQATKRRQRVAKPREEWDETQTTHYPISPLPPPPIIGKVCTAAQ